MSKLMQKWLNWRILVVEDSRLSFGAKGMALYLNTYMNDRHDFAYPSIETICGELNITNKTAIKYLTELKVAGWLRKHKRFGRTTEYYATIPDVFNKDGRISSEEPASKFPSSGNSPVVEDIHSSSGNSPLSVVETLHTNKQVNNQGNNQKDITTLSGQAPTPPSSRGWEAETKILEHLNASAGRSYKVRNGKGVSSNLKIIRQRLKEHSEKELISVIDAKVQAWGRDDKMAPYLRPATLFGQSKCEQYVGELNAAHVKERDYGSF